MSSAGVFADIYQDGQKIGEAIMIGRGVPKIHRSDGLPQYFVTGHPDGDVTPLKGGDVECGLLAYPAEFPGPGKRSNKTIYAKHEWLVFDAHVPIFDGV